MSQYSFRGASALLAPEVPPGISSPPVVDVAREWRKLRAAVKEYAAKGYPLIESPDAPMPVERAVEQAIETVQRDVLVWQRTVAEQLDPVANAAEAKVEILVEESARTEQALKEVRAAKAGFEAATTSQARRFDRAVGVLPVVGVASLVGLETWLLKDPVGRLFDWAPREAWAGTFASLGLQEVIFAGTGVVIARWLAFSGTPRERHVHLVAVVIGVVASLATAAGLMGVRINAATDSGGWGGAALFCGLQLGLLLISTALGFHEADPEAAEARRLDREEQYRAAVHGGTEAERGELTTAAERLRSYPLEGVTGEYQASIKAAALHLVQEFRSDLIVAHLAKGNFDSVSRIEELPLPEFSIPSLDDDLDEDDLVGGRQLPLF